MNLIFDHLVRWLAPSLSFTCEEAWKAKGNTSSIHLEDFLKASQDFKNNDIANKWNIIKNIRNIHFFLKSRPLNFFFKVELSHIH